MVSELVIFLVVVAVVSLVWVFSAQLDEFFSFVKKSVDGLLHKADDKLVKTNDAINDGLFALLFGNKDYKIVNKKQESKMYLTKEQVDNLLTVKVKLENHWWTLESAISEAKKIGVGLDYSGREELIKSIEAVLFDDIKNDPLAYSKLRDISMSEIGGIK